MYYLEEARKVHHQVQLNARMQQLVDQRLKLLAKLEGDDRIGETLKEYWHVFCLLYIVDKYVSEIAYELKHCFHMKDTYGHDTYIPLIHNPLDSAACFYIYLEISLIQGLPTFQILIV